MSRGLIQSWNRAELILIKIAPSNCAINYHFNCFNDLIKTQLMFGSWKKLEEKLFETKMTKGRMFIYLININLFSPNLSLNIPEFTLHLLTSLNLTKYKKHYSANYAIFLFLLFVKNRWRFCNLQLDYF